MNFLGLKNIVLDFWTSEVQKFVSVRQFWFTWYDFKKLTVNECTNFTKLIVWLILIWLMLIWLTYMTHIALFIVAYCYFEVVTPLCWHILQHLPELLSHRPHLKQKGSLVILAFQITGRLRITVSDTETYCVVINILAAVAHAASGEVDHTDAVRSENPINQSEPLP